MFKKTKPNDNVRSYIGQFPHCDARILHAPGECEFCDKHPEWQALRIAWGVAFTGYEPEDKELPCPADHARGDTHQQWSGNIARPAGTPEFLSAFTIVGSDPLCKCGTTLICPIHTPRDTAGTLTNGRPLRHG